MQETNTLVRTIGRWSLMALMLNSIVGSGIFGLPSALAARLGGLSPLVCILAGLGVLMMAACIAEVSSYYDETGGLYLYAPDAFGRFAGLLTGWLIWLTRIAAPAAAANLFCTFLAQFFPAVATKTGTLLVLVTLICVLAYFNYIGVKTGSAVSNIFTTVKVGFLAFFVVAGLTAIVMRPEIRVPYSVPVLTAKSWSEALLLLVFAYGGFEGALAVGGETKNPKRDTPFALLGALALLSIFYTGVQFVTVTTLPNAALSSRPLSDAARIFMGPVGATAITIAALISASGYLSACFLHTPRISYALAKQGDFPAFLGAVHPKYRTPHVSILAFAVLLFAFSALGNFKWNAVLSAVSRLAVYAAMAFAVPVLRRRKGRTAQFRVPAPYLFAGTSVLICTVLLSQMGWRDFLVVGSTCAIALANWLLVKGKAHDQAA